MKNNIHLRGRHLFVTSAEDYAGSLIGKEVIPNLAHYGEDFAQTFPRKGLAIQDVFTVFAECYLDGERIIQIRNDANKQIASQAYRFNMLEL